MEFKPEKRVGSIVETMAMSAECYPPQIDFQVDLGLYLD